MLFVAIQPFTWLNFNPCRTIPDTAALICMPAIGVTDAPGDIPALIMNTLYALRRVNVASFANRKKERKTRLALEKALYLHQSTDIDASFASF